MADVKEPFSTLDDGSGVGVTLAKRVEGDAAASENGAIGFAFKDSSGNVVLPALDAAGNLPVAFMDKPKKSAKGELAAGSLSLVLVTGASVVLTANKVYTNLALMVSCRSDSLFQLVHVDDSAGTPVETVVAEALVGAGQYSFHALLPDFVLDTTGGTGVILLEVKAKNFALLNSLRASFSCAEAI